MICTVTLGHDNNPDVPQARFQTEDLFIAASFNMGLIVHNAHLPTYVRRKAAA